MDIRTNKFQDEAMQSWQPTIDRSEGPLYRALADAIGQAIARGELAAGTRLPPQRQLAASLGVDLTTITRGYAEAQRRGLVNATVGRGTFVQADRPAPVAATANAAAERPAIIDMSMNLPPVPQNPSLRTALQDGLESLLRRGDIRTLMSYRAGAGTRADRVAAAAWLNPVLGEVDPDRLVVAEGAQCALTALMAMLARPGDTVLAEPLVYPGFRALAAQLGVRLVTVATDHDGPLPAAVERACQDLGPKAMYLVPTIHNPSTATIPPERRLALATLAVRHGMALIEDDAYGLFPSAPLSAVTAGASGAGYYVSTLAKCVAPGLRLAFVAAPDTAEAIRLASALRATSLAPSPLLTNLLTQWVQDGTALALRDAIRAEATARQAMMRAALPAGSFAAHPEGLHAWLTLPPRWNRLDFCAHVRRQGLALVPADAFAVDPPVPNAVRICLGVADRREVLDTALRSVAAAMQSEPPTPLAEVI
jgi:DNA-binding transcriptional MocR family regulator